MHGGAGVPFLDISLESEPRNPVYNPPPKKTSCNAEIQEQYENGEPVPSLAERFGISKARVYQILNEA